jgi:hypothetical protein
MLKIDKYEAGEYLLRALGGSRLSFFSFTAQQYGLKEDNYLQSRVVQEFFHPSNMLDFRRNVYEITQSSFEDMRSIMSKQDSKWKHVKFGVDYQVEMAPLTDLPLTRNNQSVYFAHRCKMNVTTSLSMNDLLEMFAEEANSNAFLATKGLDYKRYSPVYSFEWYNGSLDVIHLPVMSLSSGWRKELVALRAVDKKKHQVLWRALLPPALSAADLQLLTAQHHNLRHDPYPLNLNQATASSNPFLRLLLGVAIRVIEDGAKSKYEITVVRYSSALQTFPWLEWYVNSYLYFPTVFVRLKNIIGNTEMKKEVEEQLRTQGKATA